MENFDKKTVQDFGREWNLFNQEKLSDAELHTFYIKYFRILPSEILNQNNIGADIGSGSGRWAKIIAPKVKKLFCVDASKDAIEVAKRNLSNQSNVVFLNCSLGKIPLEDASLDFAYSLGVLHHIPDTFVGIQSCVQKLKVGAPLLIYLYYAFDNKPYWFYYIWRLSDLFRKIISKLPFKLKVLFTDLIALLIYFPLARLSLILEKYNIDISNVPLSAYRNNSFYTMRTDALDRFGTRVEHRFTKNEIESMLSRAGLVNIKFSEELPYWCAIGYKG